MATASEIVTAAYRESNLIAVGTAPTVAQQTEALALLNRLLPATVGQEAGQDIAEMNIGGPYEQYLCDFVPENIRLVLDLSGARTLQLHPRPYDGQRLALVDAGGNLATNNLTLDGNGRKIEGAPTLVLNTNGDSREWLYRADLGNWVRIDTVALVDAMPFPVEYDDYFAILLAMRLAPRYGQGLPGDSAQWLQSQAARLAARYRKPRGNQHLDGAHALGPPYGYSGSINEFLAGRPL